MEIKKQYKIKAAIEAAIAEMTDKYREQGYAISSEYQMGNFLVDLYCEKDNIKYAFEFKTRGRYNYESIEAMREYAKANGIHFRLVIVRIPVDKHISVEGIEETLEQHFIYDMPSDLDSISTLTRVLGMEQSVLTSL